MTSEQWGQKVAAVVVLNPAHVQTGKGGKTFGVMDMRRALKDKLANYKIPQELKAVEELPKNAMGKSVYFYPLDSINLTYIKSTRKVWSRRYLGIRLDSAAYERETSSDSGHFFFYINQYIILNPQNTIYQVISSFLKTPVVEYTHH